MRNVVISKSVKNLAGVYAIWNQTNSKVYIGSSKNIKNRVTNHLTKLNNQKHSIKDLQRDFDNGDNFLIFQVLEVDNVRNLRYYEGVAMICFDSIENGYNLQTVADCESVELNRIRLLAGNVDYFNNGADENEKNSILNRIING